MIMPDIRRGIGFVRANPARRYSVVFASSLAIFLGSFARFLIGGPASLVCFRVLAAQLALPRDRLKLRPDNSVSTVSKNGAEDSAVTNTR
jgi:hypothetical protein